MISPLVFANEALAFLLEIVAIAALTFWGWRAGGVLLAFTLPVAAIVLWALFAAPRARFPVPLAAQLAVKAVVFGGATLGFAATGHPILASVFAVVVVANTAAATVWRSRSLASAPAPAPVSAPAPAPAASTPAASAPDQPDPSPPGAASDLST